MDLREYLKAHPPRNEPFKPCAYHTQDGDLLHIWFENVLAVSEQTADGLLHIHRAEDGRIVGVTVWSVSKLLKEQPS